MEIEQKEMDLDTYMSRELGWDKPNEGVRIPTKEKEEGGKFTLYKCWKCKSNNCIFHEVQTRALDEPATLFVQCIECGNRWRQ